MKITSKMVREIKRACREACGGRRKVEIGHRWWPGMAEDEDGFNFLVWGEDNDLSDLTHADDMAGQEVRASGGWVALDCYCYNLPVCGREPDDALDCNVYVLLSPLGEVVYASDDDMGHCKAINAILLDAGHPGYRQPVES